MVADLTWTLPPTNSKGDEKQVMTNLNGTCNWTQSPGLIGYMSGYKQNNTSTTVMTFGTTDEPSICRSTDMKFDLIIVSTKTITTSVTGIGGISDTYNPVSANQAYDVYAIADNPTDAFAEIIAVEAGTDPEAMIEISSGDNNVWRRIGWFITQDGSTAIIPHTCGGKARGRTFHYTGDRADQAILFAGSATTWTDMTSGGNGSDHYTANSSHHMICRIAFGDSAAANEEVAFRENGSTNTMAEAAFTFSAGSALAVGTLADGQMLIHLNETDRITEYENSSASNESYCYIIAFNFGI